MNANYQSKAGTNLFELILFVAVVGITAGVALTVGRRFGFGWGVLAAPVALAAVFGLYALFYWAVGFLPYPSRTQRHQKRTDDTDSHNTA